ncbi:YhdP family protein [Aestuariibacter salexigens]|uniref:YhdP family protein n=1 Tax=Aestuariibacter salexigens TaxID=226010 RepID=UPI00040B2984|nr:YhdP family protein [Aestuariibacter salexigens]
MKTATEYAAYIVKKLWTLAAILLVLFAVAISVLRYSLPYMDDKKDLFEEYVATQYGVDVSIGSLSATWNGLGPAIVLNDVVLTQNESSPVGIHITETQIELDFWATVRSQMIKSKRFELIGMNLDVDLERLQQGSGNFPVVDALASLFLEQLQQFSLRQSRINIKSTHNQQTIQLLRVSWFNRGERHQGTGQLRVDELAKNSAYFALDLRGDKSNLNGVFYAKAEDLDVSPWVNELLQTDAPLSAGRGNFVYWAGIQNGSLANMQLRLEESSFSWDTQDGELVTKVKGGQLFAIPDQQGWIFNLNDVLLQIDDEIVMSTWAGRIDNAGNITLNSAEPITLSPLKPLLALYMGEQQKALFAQLDPTLRVDKLQMNVRQQGISALSEFRQLGWRQTEDIPGIQDLHGSFYWYKNQGKLSISAEYGEVLVDNLLPENLIFNQLAAQIYLDDTAQGMSVVVPELMFVSDPLSFTQSMRLNTADSRLSLQTHISSVDVTDLPLLFPERHMGKETREYLIDAFGQRGEVVGANVLWHGALEAFPFTEQNGIFQASVYVQQADFRFSDEWPMLEELDIELLFENEGLTMRSPSSRLMGVNVGQMTAVIPRLADGAVLTIDAQGSGTGTQLTELMLESSLASSVGRTLQQGVVVEGDIQATLNLTIPLSGNDVVARGEVLLRDNPMQFPSVGLNTQQANGVIKFVNDKVTAEGLTALLFEQPIEVVFDGEDTRSGYQANARLSGQWQILPLIERLNPAFTEYVSGAQAWQADLSLTLPEDGFDYEFILRSDMRDIASTLPAPFAKRQDRPLPLLISSKGNEQASTLAINLGEDIRFNGILPHRELQFSRAHLALGESDFVGLGVGFSISANLPEIDASEWYRTIELLLSGVESAQHSVLNAPERIFVEAQQLHIAGQTIESVEMTAKQRGQDWLLAVNSEQARADLTLFDDWNNKGVDIDADFIRLSELRFDKSTQADDGASVSWKPESLPPIRLECRSCSVFGYELGNVSLRAVKAESGLAIERLLIQSAHAKLDASGDWLLSEQVNSTHLSGTLESSDFGQFLQGFDLQAGIKDSEADFNFDLSWSGSPFDFGFEQLNGGVKWNLTDGYLTQVSDQGSRIFTLLSLNSLVRKLSLDFRDVFAKGFFYDKMDGSFSINDGTVLTRDTVIDGGAGEMTIEGYTDLVSRELNYNVSFTPNVTGNLPFLVYFMVNAPTAIAALAIDQVLTSAKVISNVNYSVTGTLDEPILTETGRDSREIELPAQRSPGDDQPVSPAEPDQPVEQTSSLGSDLPRVSLTISEELNSGA